MATKRSVRIAKWMVRAIEYGLIAEDIDGHRINATDAMAALGAALTQAECAFLRRSKDRRNLDVWRNGWPDFLLQNSETGQHFAVEVKAGSDSVSIAQRRMFGALERAGISVFVWNPARPDTLIAWRKYKTSVSDDQSPLTLTDQRDVYEAWKRGNSALRLICERLGASYDALTNLLDEQEERNEYKHSQVIAQRERVKRRSRATDRPKPVNTR